MKVMLHQSLSLDWLFEFSRRWGTHSYQWRHLVGGRIILQVQYYSYVLPGQFFKVLVQKEN